MNGSTSLPALLLVAAATGACAADGDRRARAAHDAEYDADHDADPMPVEASAEPTVNTPEVRPRLWHTVTLGESVGGEAAEDPSAATATGEPPPVIVVVEPSYGVWGYGAPGWVSSPAWDGWDPYPGWHGRVPAEPSARPRSPRPWSPPPEYGPRFPFKTAPADPWR